jgi:hypothetical protein
MKKKEVRGRRLGSPSRCGASPYAFVFTPTAGDPRQIVGSAARTSFIMQNEETKVNFDAGDGRGTVLRPGPFVSS